MAIQKRAIQRQVLLVKGVVEYRDKILLVKRKLEGFEEAHGKWEFPGGKIDIGEDPEDAVIREVKEETGYDVEVISLIPHMISPRWKTKEMTVQLIIASYRCRLKDGKINLQDHGVMDVKWFKPSDVLKLECLPGTHEMMHIYLKSKVSGCQELSVPQHE